jgi:Lon protease-like protein
MAGSLGTVAEEIDSLPLFPLGIVLLPGEVVPLHIFEERYKTMIGECLDQDSDFGILWLSDDGLKQIGCTASVTQLLERMDDGRMNVLVQGGRPFKLVRKIEELAYPAGDVELLDDEDDGAVDPDVAADARARYADLVARVTDDRPAEQALTDLDAYGMAATIDFALDAKQSLLEIRSEQERMRAVAELFGTTMQKIDYVEKVREQARSNGKAHR